jgi:hypothetical protein
VYVCVRKSVYDCVCIQCHQAGFGGQGTRDTAAGSQSYALGFYCWGTSYHRPVRNLGIGSLDGLLIERICTRQSSLSLRFPFSAAEIDKSCVFVKQGGFGSQLLSFSSLRMVYGAGARNWKKPQRRSSRPVFERILERPVKLCAVQWTSCSCCPHSLPR